MDYVFILGRNSQLSAAEIKAVFPQGKIIEQAEMFLLLSHPEFDCQKVLERLGGTIKIGQIISQKINLGVIAKELLKEKSKGKINFGISDYRGKTNILKLGLEIKKKLRELGISSRLVVSREPVLSSVVVAKNKCQEFLILGDGWLGRTLAVQKFEDYSFRDYGRPARDILAGTLPPKLAKIMLNLARRPAGGVILDPFCGSGTILQEAAALGYQKIIGADVSEKAINDTKLNLEWFSKNFQFPVSNFQIFNLDVRHLTQKISPGSIDAIITEPYLGPALKGRESKKEIEKIVGELEELYQPAFREFAKILKPGGRVVIIFPWFKKYNLSPDIFLPIKKLGFVQLNQKDLVYSRADQRVWRKIFVFQK